MNGYTVQYNVVWTEISQIKQLKWVIFTVNLIHEISSTRMLCCVTCAAAVWGGSCSPGCGR